MQEMCPVSGPGGEPRWPDEHDVRRPPAPGLRHRPAKRFFEDVVYPAPDGLQRFRAKPDKTWRLDLAENAPVVPADIAAILQPLLR